MIEVSEVIAKVRERLNDNEVGNYEILDSVLVENINQAKESATTQITANKTQALTNINETKESAQAQINANKQEVLNNITQARTTATSEINEAKKTDHYQNIDFFEIE